MISIDTGILEALPDLTLVVRRDGVIVGNVGGRHLGQRDQAVHLLRRGRGGAAQLGDGAESGGTGARRVEWPPHDAGVDRGGHEPGERESGCP